jgi:hypothetical protein
MSRCTSHWPPIFCHTARYFASIAVTAAAGNKSIATTQADIDVNDEMKRAAVELVG